MQLPNFCIPQTSHKHSLAMPVKLHSANIRGKRLPKKWVCSTSKYGKNQARHKARRAANAHFALHTSHFILRTSYFALHTSHSTLLLKMVRIQDHLGKLSWTVADKILFIGYGFVNIVQNNALPAEELGLYALFMAVQTFLFTVSDSFILQAIILHGGDAEKRAGINRFALFWHTVITVGGACVLLVLQSVLADFFDDARIAVVMRYLPLMSLVSIPRKIAEKHLQRAVQARAIFAVDIVWFGTMTLLSAYFLAVGQLQSFEIIFLISLCGMAASSVVSYTLTRKLLNLRNVGVGVGGAAHISWKELLNFGAYQGTAGMLANVIKQLDVTLVQYFFNTATVGVYQSAKTLFRFFDEALNAITGLVYPTTVRLVRESKEEQILALFSKMLSFGVVLSLCAIALVYAGVAEWLVSLVLAPKYAAALGYIKLLVLSTPAMPFLVLVSYMIARGDGKFLLVSIASAVGCGVAALCAVGYVGISEAVPLGIMTYYLVEGSLCFAYLRRWMHFPTHLLWRAVPDTLSFLGIWKRKNISDTTTKDDTTKDNTTY
ncbi:MAG: hypothetical protein EAZ92_09870 [Candidatus Kapaibacterium sp.]|nr:MAG: hypothetical protein EAZ92_09870 [Candidatus Kapabacteria bacterium]